MDYVPNIEEHRFPCDACGADMRYAPGQGALTCHHCGQSDQIVELATSSISELDFRKGLAKDDADMPTQDIRLSHCENCGADVEFETHGHAAECPFCASPIVIDTGITRQIKPQGLVPFAITQEQGRAAMSDWLGRLWFAPSGLQDYARKGRKLQGMYVPFWTFDADTKSSYSGSRGTIYYVTQTVQRDGKSVQKRVQKIRWHAKSGRVARWFDDVLVLASRALPKKFTDALAPWELSALEPYTPEYLAGFRAEGYGVPLDEGFTEARAHIDAIIRRDVKFDIGGDRQRIHSVDTQISDITFKHVLLPVWMAAYKYRGRTFRFVVNGQSGKVQGERPWSAIKLAMAAIALAVIAGTIGYVIAMNGGAG